MRVQPFATQLRRILAEYERKRSIFDIHESLFHVPSRCAPFAVPGFFGKYLAAPVGPSAGPQTQLSQNIVSAWVCGGR
ncbi:MAG: putative selenate reductase subunit YgfK, partial [Acidobacteria bacterium]